MGLCQIGTVIFQGAIHVTELNHQNPPKEASTYVGIANQLVASHQAGAAEV